MCQQLQNLQLDLQQNKTSRFIRKFHWHEHEEPQTDRQIQVFKATRHLTKLRVPKLRFCALVPSCCSVNPNYQLSQCHKTKCQILANSKNHINESRWNSYSQLQLTNDRATLKLRFLKNTVSLLALKNFFTNAWYSNNILL